MGARGAIWAHIQIYEDLLISKLLSVIIEKWMRRDRLLRKIFIQQDRVKNHISEDDTVFMEALMEKGIKAKLYTQAANSLDIILLDLGFFRVIQSFNNAVPKNKEELIQAVSVASESYLQNKINHTWLILQCCFNQIMGLSHPYVRPK